MVVGSVLRIYYFADSDNKIQWESSQVEVTDGKWHHALMTVSDKKEEGMRLYIDGVLRESTPWVGQPRVCSNRSVSVTIGSYDDVFNGLLREAAVWGAVLGEDEIMRLSKHTPSSLIKPQQLIGAWPCDEGEGDTMHDLANKHKGTLHKPTWKVVDE
jgi:hypothetical protein